NIGICGSVLKYYNNPENIQAYGGGIINRFLGTAKHIINKKEIDKVDYIVGASMLINKKVIAKKGLLPEEYFLYYEDTDYGFSAKIQGFKLGVCLNSVVYHKEGASTKKNSDFIDCLYLKNKIKFHKKFLRNYVGLFITVGVSLIKRLNNVNKTILCIKDLF
ncbi:glycosyltransferase family 2 protein, partial [Caminibacter sp.]